MTVSPDGQVLFLTPRDEKGLDLADLGHATVERVGSIEFDRNEQRFWVKILRGFPQAEPLRAEHLRAEGLDPENFLIDRVAEDGRLLFRRYDHAVSAEQAIVAMLLYRGSLW